MVRGGEWNSDRQRCRDDVANSQRGQIKIGRVRLGPWGVHSSQVAAEQKGRGVQVINCRVV